MNLHPVRSSISAAILLAVYGLLVTGCEHRRVDTSTDEKMKKSVEDARNTLPEKDRAKFDESLTALAMNQVNLSDVFSGNTAGAQTKMKDAIRGKTAEEIISAGQKIISDRRIEQERAKAERERSEQEQAKAEITELRQKKQRAEKAKAELAKFKITRSRFYKEPQKYGNPEPVIALSLTNNTSVAVSRAYFVGTLATPGRSVPWLKETFNYSIQGGLEPGESQDLSLAPNMFGEWGRVKAPPDAVLTVNVTRIDGPDGKAAFDAQEFTDQDAERIAALETNFPK